MTNNPATARFGKRTGSVAPVTARTGSIDDQIEALVRSRAFVGAVAWWTITALAIALAIMVAGNSSNRLDSMPTGPMAMLLSEIQFSEDLQVSRFLILSFEIFGVYSSRYVFLGSVMAGLWGVVAFVLVWIRRKRISRLGVALVAGAAVIIAFASSAPLHSREASATQRFTTVKTIERELGILTPNTRVTDQWLRDIRHHAANTPIAVRVAEANRQAPAKVSPEDIKFADAVAYEQTKFVAAQYWAIKGEPEKARVYLPLDMEFIIFHPESRIAVAHRICWLSEATERPATDENTLAQLCARAGIWRAALILTQIAKQVFQFGLPVFAVSILVFAGLSIRLQMIRNRRREVPDVV